LLYGINIPLDGTIDQSESSIPQRRVIIKNLADPKLYGSVCCK